MDQDNLAALGVFLLVSACVASAIMVVRGDADTRRLESRLRSASAATGGPTGAAKANVPARSIRRTDSGSPLIRALERMGRSRHIPKEHRIPWPVVTAVGVAAGVAGSYLASKIIGLGVAPVIGIAAAAFFVRLVFRMESSKYQAKLFRQVPDAMSLILRAIRAGLPMGEALANVAHELESPSREEFAQVVGNIGIGQPVDSALFGLAERSGLTEYYFFAVTVGLQAQTGGNLGETLENLADMVRKRVALASKVKAMTGEARISAIIMAMLPFAVGGLVSVLAPGHLDPLIETDFGFRLLLIGGTMLAVGLMIIRGLVKGAVKD